MARQYLAFRPPSCGNGRTGHEGEIIIAPCRAAPKSKAPKTLSPKNTKGVKGGFPRTRGSVIVYDTMLSP